MKVILISALMFLCTVHPINVPAQTQQPDTNSTHRINNQKLSEFETFVSKEMERDGVPAMTIGLLRDGAMWIRAFGYSDVENKTPARENSAYRIASTTKTMTGAAIVQLAERGKIDLDAEIQTYVPDYARQRWPVTVRQLLTHLGGGQGPSGLGPEQVSMKELVARLSATQITVEPGTRFVYGTGAYNLLAAAIENVTGGSFEKYLRENLWLPAGMKETYIDDVRGLIPNRVHGYDRADGELKNAPFVNLSSRIGGGGVTSTVPDLLRWAQVVIDQKVVSPKWHAEMLSPVTVKSGRWSGIGDADEYYTLGWMIRPVNGNFVINHGGSQKGTASAFFVFPARQMAIVILSNLEFAPLDKYVRQLFELVTGEEWTTHVATRDPMNTLLPQALDSTFNYGALHYWQYRTQLAKSEQELAEAFQYFNTNTSKGALQTPADNPARRIRDGRHPNTGSAFIKIGSFITSKLIEKNGSASFTKYHQGGSIPFFADYIRLYKSGPGIPDNLRFEPDFESLIEKWSGDWSRTWNEYTRNVELTPHADLGTIGDRLKALFAGAEVYPDFSESLQRIQQGEAAFVATKLGIDLYPKSDELLFNLGYFLIIAEQRDGGRVAVRKLIGDYESPLVYFRRAFEVNPNGVMAAGTFLDLGKRWLRRSDMHGTAIEFVRAGIALHPASGALHELLGDLLLRKGESNAATTNFRKAYELNPKLGNGASLEEYVSTRMKGN